MPLPTMAPLKENDPVYVERENQQLEGIVAFLGPVKFAGGEDWVGVRLTGSSVGLGKNDGSVKGVRYFQCSKNGGVFVRRSHVSRRNLTRLEELRLKRELAKQTATTATPRKARTSSIPTVSSSISTPATTAASTSSASMAPVSTSSGASSPIPRTTSSSSIASGDGSKKSRLEELRERRAARADKQPDLSNPEPPYDIYDADDSKTAALEGRIRTLEDKLQETTDQATSTSEKLKAKEEETASLQQSLSKAEQDIYELTQRNEQLQQDIENNIGPTLQLSSDKVQDQLAKAYEDARRLEREKSELKDSLEKLQAQNDNLQRDLTREREGRASDAETVRSATSDAAILQRELDALKDQAASRGASDVSHYKEKAKLQAEMGAMRRQIEELEKEKMDMEAMMEELTLDKEQLQEEKEILADKVEELKIDAETAQMEAEELRLELEDAQAATTEGGFATSSSMSAEDADAAQALATQNARLREALIRLREQTSLDKMETARQLRAAEKEAAEGKAIVDELAKAKAKRSTLEEEVKDLKEMVEQGSAFEGMVEDLSDRVMALEDDNVALQSTIREMEEAADVMAELEEVQADENKALMRDLEGRDAIIRNLEEAIRMQRRREEDFQRTVGNYRTTVETLKQEKNELLALQRGGEGEKSTLLATSQKALARAAQLVTDAANARKKVAEAAFDQIEGEVNRHLASRLQSLIPQGVVSSEVAAIKGELLLCKIAGKASKTLDGVSSAFSLTIRDGMRETLGEADTNGAVSDSSLSLADDAAQGVENMIHQTKFSLSTIELSTELLRLLAAGQWPDLLSIDSSVELGTLLGHSLSDVDHTMGSTLKVLKEEGALSPHRSNLGAFKQSVQTSLEALKNTINTEGRPLLTDDWDPPAWELLKNVSVAKFLSLGAGASVAAALNPEGATAEEALKVAISLKDLVSMFDQIGAEASKIGPRLTNLDVTNSKVVKELETVSIEWMKAAERTFDAVQSLFAVRSQFKVADIESCKNAAERILRSLAKMASSLRAADLNTENSSSCHPLSSEGGDPWRGITDVAIKVRSIDGDAEDVNFLIRARALEQRFGEAIENEPKLEASTAKIANLEKTLFTKSKEIAMQNARLTELERLLTRTTTQPTPRKTLVSVTAEEISSLREENRVLTEAMDVMQQQVDEYEAEIRLLKDPKSPRGRGLATPKRGSMQSDYGRRASGGFDVGGAEVSQATVAAMEAAFFRPALEAARKEASDWKANAFATAMGSLPPLDIPTTEGESKEDDPAMDALAELNEARNQYRMDLASLTLIDLTRTDKSARAQHLENLAKSALADERLRAATAKASRFLSSQGHPPPTLSNLTDLPLLGKVKVERPGATQVLPLQVTKDDIVDLQLHMLA